MPSLHAAIHVATEYNHATPSTTHAQGHADSQLPGTRAADLSSTGCQELSSILVYSRDQAAALLSLWPSLFSTPSTKRTPAAFARYPNPLSRRKPCSAASASLNINDNVVGSRNPFPRRFSGGSWPVANADSIGFVSRVHPVIRASQRELRGDSQRRLLERGAVHQDRCLHHDPEVERFFVHGELVAQA
jgi:hypothetical protein